jgi:hypothetical protein
MRDETRTTHASVEHPARCARLQRGADSEGLPVYGLEGQADGPKALWYASQFCIKTHFSALAT